LVGVKNVVFVDISDFAHGVANDLHVIEFRLGGDFTAHDNDIALGVGFTGDAAFRVLGKARVQHRIGNRVTNFVWVSFTHGLGGKNEATKHGGMRKAKRGKAERLENVGSPDDSAAG